MNVNWVPQFFYDFIARILSGAVVIFFALLVYYGVEVVEKAFLSGSFNKIFASFISLMVGVILSYFVGIVLGHLWGMTLERLVREKNIDDEMVCKKDCLMQYNKVIIGTDNPQLKESDRAVADLPKVFVMLDHLRVFAQPESFRLLKLKAEQRFCHVIVMGFVCLGLINLFFVIGSSSVGRIILEAVMIISIIACWSLAMKFHKHFVTGVCIAWLIRFKPDGSVKPVG